MDLGWSNRFLGDPWSMGDVQISLDQKILGDDDVSFSLCLTSGLVGDLPGYGTMWIDPQAIVSVLSLRLVKKKYHISYDSHDKNGFILQNPTKFEFQESKSGLHYLDTSKQIGVEAKKEETELYKNECHLFVVNTVAHNHAQHTNNDYLHAIQAQELQIKTGCPSTRDYLHLLKLNGLLSCPVTLKDVQAAE